ncbi:MAG TPA: hypothetical protein VFS75_02365 [Candidatus Paceibacterota bacterium]|nr:hypothetical protein [Candidatus Paceibacterota bacterium]
MISTRIVARTFAVLIGVFFVGSLGYLAHYALTTPEPVSCPSDAFICPDGNTVGRVGPSCAFAPCPDVR